MLVARRCWMNLFSSSKRAPCRNCSHLMATSNKPPIPPHASTNTLVDDEDNKLVPAILHRRYKRFLADCEVPLIKIKPHILVHPPAPQVDGVMHVVFCPNTGPMTGLLDHVPCPAKLSVSDKPGRKYRYTLEWLQPNPQSPTWVGVHSARANHYVAAMLERGLLQPLLGMSMSHTTRREVPYGTRSRVDFVLQEGKCSTYVEVKSVTLTQQERDVTVAVFPDTVSTRAQQHARELTALLCTKASAEEQGKRRRVEGKARRAVMLFVVQRDDAQEFAPCKAKDPAYAALCVQAAAAGVQLVAVAIRLNEEDAVEYVRELPVVDV